MKHNPVAVARASYQAYVDKDRAAIEALIADDFHFTSPLDNRIGRATYFARCWPNSATLAGFDFIHIVPDGDLVFVTYEGRSTSGKRFRNSGILTKILDAAMQVIRAKGYSATTIEDVCLAAGLTKGSFFHHFKSKEELALAAAGHFAAWADGLIAQAPYHALDDPLDRVLGYVDFRKAILGDNLPERTCLLGTMVQETFQSYPAIRETCDAHISAHAAELVKDITEAKLLYAPDAAWSAESLGLYTQAVIQGAFILAKAKNGPEIAGECLDHLRRYVEMLFDQPKSKG